MAGTNDSSKTTSRAILVIVGILVLSALTYFSIKYFSEKEANEANLATIEDLNSEILDLEEKILNMEVAMEDQSMELAEKDKLLEEKYSELEAMVTRVAQAKRENKANIARIKQLENRVEELMGVVDQYGEKIDELEEKNLVLTNQVDSLQNIEGQLSEQNNTLLEQNRQTSEELEETRKIASALKTNKFRYINVRKSGKERDEKEYSRRSLHSLKFCFTILENLITPSGTKEVYLVYENPDGSINTNFTEGYSGQFVHNSTERNYSVKTTIEYNNSDLEVCMPYNPEKDFKYQKGLQYISVYCDGKLIGQGNFNIK